MTSKRDCFDQLRSTAEEADRFLKSLDEDSSQMEAFSNTASPVKSEPPEDISSDDDRSLQATASGNHPAHPALVLLIIAILLSPVLLLLVWQNREESAVDTLPALRYASSCGSPPGGGKRWWPVLGPADRNLLRTIRNQYCGDAFITVDGALQAASFDSWQGAERFRQQIQQSTGAAFRVGEGADQ